MPIYDRNLGRAGHSITMVHAYLYSVSCWNGSGCCAILFTRRRSLIGISDQGASPVTKAQTRYVSIAEQGMRIICLEYLCISIIQPTSFAKGEITLSSVTYPVHSSTSSVFKPQTHQIINTSLYFLSPSQAALTGS